MSTISEKAEHVRRAGQTRNHTCHWPGCKVQCKPAAWGCRHHWYMLPTGFRNKIWAAYRIGQEESRSVSRAYIEVAMEVRNWIIKNYGDKP